MYFTSDDMASCLHVYNYANISVVFDPVFSVSLLLETLKSYITYRIS